jgi:hypothetical protein
MQNWAGQDIQKGHFVVQMGRTSKGVIRRLGVVLSEEQTDDGLRLRVGWYDPEDTVTNASESVVTVDNVVVIDPHSIPTNIRIPLEYVLFRGRASL